MGEGSKIGYPGAGFYPLKGSFLFLLSVILSFCDRVLLGSAGWPTIHYEDKPGLKLTKILLPLLLSIELKTCAAIPRFLFLLSIT